MIIQAALRKSVERFPDKIALKVEKKAYRYSDIENETNQIARGLKELGLQRGDRVVIYLDNSAEVVLGIYGILKADAIFVVLNTKTKLNKLIYIINNCEAKFMVTSRKEFPADEDLELLKKECSSLRTIILIDDRSGKYPTLRDFYSLSSDSINYSNISIDLAGLIYTSGSTGFPKGVTMAHLNIMTAVESIISYLKNTPDDIIIDALPLSFDYGMYQIFMCMTFGGTLIIQKDMVYIYQILKIIEQEKVTGFPCVPTIFSLLLKMKNFEKFDLSHLRYITNTGAAFPVPQIRRLRLLLPHVQIYSMYGLTECKRVAYLDPAQIDQRPQSVGKAMPNLEVFIVDENGNQLGPNQVGELVVRGASVMQGYWNSPEETAQKIKPGRYPLERFLYTGDLFLMDEEGFLYFLGRKDDLLKIKGERVSPKEIENVLYQMENIHEAAVIGVPDEVWGNYIKAFIVPVNHENIPDKKEIIKFCQERLESWAVPKEIVYIDSLPKTANGKIDKAKLTQN